MIYVIVNHLTSLATVVAALLFIYFDFWNLLKYCDFGELI